MANDALVDRLRSFNRFYTQRLGLITDRYLGQRRPLTEARVLFDIGDEGVQVHELRRALDLDSGFLSRTLRALERDGLVETAPGGEDRRLRVVRPTAKGRREQAEINRRADTATGALIEHLGIVERHELREALGTVERLLLVSSLRAHEVSVRPARRADARAVATLLRTTFDEQRTHFTAAAFAASTPAASEIADRVVRHSVWVAEWEGRIVGTVTAEERPPSCWVRSLAVDRGVRGLRIGERLLDEVERRAVDSGLASLELDTTPFQEAAARLYRRFGFRHVKRHEVYGTTMNRLRKRLQPGGRDVTDEVPRS